MYSVNGLFAISIICIKYFIVYMTWFDPSRFDRYQTFNILYLGRAIVEYS